jgi:hypothetical protein
VKPKAREISSAVEKLERDESVARLDRQVVAYAESHTTPELRRWLKVFIARVEADLFNERAEDERNNRAVTVVHGDNGMGALIADLPAMSADGSWLVPAARVLDLAKHQADNVFWHRMVLDPVTDDVLAHEYVGRFAPAILTKALEFRDGVCQAPAVANQPFVRHRPPHPPRNRRTHRSLEPHKL